MTGGMAALVLVSALAGTPATTPALEEAFRAGIQAYDAQDWDGAIAAWEGLSRYRIEHPAVHYNLGNAYLKKQDYGRSVLQYERALRLDPADADARENLQLVRGLLVDDVSGEKSVLARVGEEARQRVPVADATLAAFVSWQLLGLALLVAILRPGALRRAAIGVAAIAALALALSAPLTWLHLSALGDRSRMVILAPAVEVRSGPGEQYTTTFTVHEGLVVRRRESAAGWEHVQLPNGLDGWVPASALERI